MKSRLLHLKLNVLCLLCTISLTFSVSAQLEYVFHEEYYSGSLIPEGYTCYRIYAKLASPDTKLISISGSTGSPMFIGSSLEGDYIYNHIFGGIYGQALNCLLFGSYPEMEYDSFITIGLAHTNSPFCTEFYPPECDETSEHPVTENDLVSASLGDPDGGLFGYNPDLFCTNCGVGYANQSPCNAFGIGPDLRVLIAQITVPTGTLQYAFEVTTQIEGEIPVYSRNCIINEISGYGYVCNTCALVYPGDLPTILNSESTIICSFCSDPLACNYSNQWPMGIENCIYAGPCDFNCDLEQDVYDLLTFIEDFGCTLECGKPDLNIDGIISVKDLILLIDCLD